MSTAIKLYSGYRRYCGGSEVVRVEGKTVGECLDALMALFPVFRKEAFVVIYRGEVIVRGRFDRPVEDDFEIELLPIMAGG